MREYVKPTYKMEGVETEDVILASASITYVGEGTLGNITGPKAQMAVEYNALFGNR